MNQSIFPFIYHPAFADRALKINMKPVATRPYITAENIPIIPFDITPDTTRKDVKAVLRQHEEFITAILDKFAKDKPQFTPFWYNHFGTSMFLHPAYKAVRFCTTYSESAPRENKKFARDHFERSYSIMFLNYLTAESVSDRQTGLTRDEHIILAALQDHLDMHYLAKDSDDSLYAYISEPVWNRDDEEWLSNDNLFLITPDTIETMIMDFNLECFNIQLDNVHLERFVDSDQPVCFDIPDYPA